MKKIGLTGGIASGKSSVAAWFKQKNVPIFDADQTVHQLMAQTSMIASFKRELGAMFIEHGKINRTLLGEHVFRDPALKNKLENLVHPWVEAEMKRQIDQAENQQKKLMLLDIPLLFEVGWDRLVDEVWVVYVPFSIQLARLMKRNNWTAEQAELRINSQRALPSKAKEADRIIDNGGTWLETEQQLERIWREFE